MASNLPQPQSNQQILGQALSSYAAALGINDQNVSAANVQFFKVVALIAARSSGDIFQILRDYSLDRATGEALKRLGIEDGVPPISSAVATGYVTVTDTSFQKIATKIYAGLNPPIAGSVTIYVSDASLFPASGSVYIGRGSVNVEGPLAYSAKTQVGSYWSLTLSSPTTKFHNISESVILSQGGVRTVPVNTIVVSPGIGTAADVQFTVTQVGTILDGEVTVSNVPVTALVPGSSGNVAGGSISQFAGEPFANAVVTNPLTFTTGQDTETDDEYRVRIKDKLASTGLGTVTAIESALKGVQDPTSSATISSTDVLNSAEQTTVYVDDGSGYEATNSGVGIESIVNVALGGEKYFQLVTGGTQTSVTKAYLKTVAASPFNLSGGEVLAVTVGNKTYQHTFSPSDFANPGSATAYEVSASINADTLLGYEAVTAGGGTYVVIRSIAEDTNIIQITTPSSSSVTDANTALEFPSSKAETLRLYKNGKLLSEDGSTASIFTQPQSLWSPTLATGDTLSISVDGTNPITYVLTDADFIAEGTYESLSYSNSLQSWANVLNSNITGITATVVGSTIEITSNLGSVDRAQVTVVNTVSNPTSLISKGVISNTDLSSTGAASDYSLNRNTAQIELATPLVKGDQLSAGTLVTQANIEGNAVVSGSATLTSDAHVWIAIDTPTILIPTIKSGSTLTVSKPSANIVRYTSNSASAFSNVIPGDYVIVWSAEIPTTDQLEGRVHAVTANTLDIQVTAAEYAAATPVTNASYVQGFFVARTNNVPQKFRVQAGTKTLDVIAAELQSQTDSLTFSVLENTNIVVTTNTNDSTGEIFIVTADAEGLQLGFVSGLTNVSQDALIAFYDSQATTSELPLFFHSTISADSYAEPIDSYVTSFQSTLTPATDPNQMIKFLNPYGGIDDEQPANYNVQMSALASNTITLLPEYPDLRRLRTNDRYFIANPLDFGYNDTAVAIVDNNSVGETYTLPFYRRAITNTTYASNNYSFNAYDVDAGTNASFENNFSGFDFSNFKALLQAKKVIQESNPQTALLYRSTLWGRSGEKINIGYVYPTIPNSAISSTVLVTDVVTILISLMSGTAISTSIDSTTQWNVTITNNNPVAGVEQVTYTYNGTGTTPGLTLNGGEYVTINSTTGFNAANQGTFRVSTATGFTPTATSFSVQRPSGSGLAQANVNTTVPSGMSFYNSTPTTAAAVNTYVNANLSQYVTSTIVNDGGTSGSGIIALSSYEDSAFTAETYFLEDGINWIASSDINGSPQFTFKKPLNLNTDTGYAFNNGDEVRLIPTTMDQVQRLLSVLAVTGFTTVGTIEVVDNDTKLQFATTTLGSAGSIQIVGGNGNEYSVPVLTSGELVDNTNMMVSANTIAAQAVASDQWFRLQAENAQKKDTGIDTNTSVTVLSNTPLGGQSTITLLNRNSSQRYFGQPRHRVRVEGDTFRIEKQGSLVCLSWNGQGTNPQFSAAINFNDTAGGTVNVSASGIYTIASGVANFSALSIGDQITVTGMVNAANNGTFFVESVALDGSSFGVANSEAVVENGTTFAHGNFTSISAVSEGDTMILSSPFTPLNQGEYRVIRMFNNSVWYENPNAVEEEITCSANPVSLGYDATTTFNVAFTNGEMVLQWTGTGTQPFLGNAQPGDIATFGTNFSTANQGNFVVTNSGVAQQQVVQFSIPAGSTFASSGAGDYFEIYNGGNADKYYVWYNVGGGNTDPAPSGFIGVPVAINNSDSAATVATKTNAAFSVLTNLSSSVVSNVLTLTTTDYETANAPVNVSMPSAFSFVVTQSGQRTFLSVINPSAVAQSGATAVALTVNRPQIMFYEYEASVPGDLLTVNGLVLGSGNAGNYSIVKVLNRNTVVVTGIISQQYNTSISGNQASLSVTEGTPYNGYKQVLLVAMQPGTTNFTNIVFNTNANYDKIGLSAGVAMTSLGKLNFPTTIKTGLDSYNYDTGLIGEANRVIYGDPRDQITYPGVNALGTNIFIREPLLLRVQIALSIRTNIGVSFTQITNQIQSSVYSLIKSNPLGQSIDLSSIVETVRLIPGVTSVVLTNPAYSVNSDEIQLVTGQKAFIASQTTDISVSLLGT